MRFLAREFRARVTNEVACPDKIAEFKERKGRAPQGHAAVRRRSEPSSGMAEPGQFRESGQWSPLSLFRRSRRTNPLAGRSHVQGLHRPLGPAHGKRPQTRRAACASRISGCSSSTPWCGCSPLPRAIPDGLGAARGPCPAIGTTRTTASSASEPAVVERALGPTTMSAVRVAVAELTRRASMKPDPRHLCHLQCWRRQRRRRCNGCPIEKTQIPACHSRLPNAALSRRSATACGARFSLSSSEARQRNLRGPL
jgi:hypothetical protein